jgi:hypothetical protein
MWGDAVNAAAKVLREVEKLGVEEALYTEEFLAHRRGEFLALPVGVSYGGGQTVRSYLWLFSSQLTTFIPQVPGNLVHTAEMRRLMQQILQSHGVRRIAGFQSSTC